MTPGENMAMKQKSNAAKDNTQKLLRKEKLSQIRDKITATGKWAWYRNVTDAATVVQAVMDERFLRKNRGSCVWVSSDGMMDSEGKSLCSDKWYRINREAGTLEKVSPQEAMTLEWYNRLFVGRDILPAIEDHMPLMMEIGVGESPILGGYYGNDFAPVARVKTK